MRKVFVDTNVWLRFLIADEPKQFETCCQLLREIEESKFRVYTSTIVLQEIIYTLTSFYKIAKKDIIEDIKNILSTRNLTLIEKTDFNSALALFSQYSVKLADCLIVSQIPKGILLCTFDQEFKNFQDVSSFSPKEVLEQRRIGKIK